MAKRRFQSLAIAAALASLAGLAHAESTSGDLIPDFLDASLSGSYLAGRSADVARDGAAAKAYYASALDDDPENQILLERVVVLHLARGEIELAEPYADRLVKLDIRNPHARLVRAVRALKDGKLERASLELSQSAEAPLAVLTGGLIAAWIDVGLGRPADAHTAIDALSGPSWYGIFKSYHQALIADLSGDKDKAMEAIAAAYETDSAALRVVEAYARIMVRNGKRAEGLAAVHDFLAEQPNNPVIRDLLARIERNDDLGPMVTTAVGGASEVLYGLGAAIGVEEGTDLPAGYLFLAHYLDPSSNLALMALGDVLLASQQCKDAIPVYAKVAADSILRRNAEIQTGICLDVLERTDEAAAHIKTVIDKNPADLEAVVALGNIYRGRNRFAEAAEVYSRGIATIANPAEPDWRIFYFRGVSLERAKRWPEAEADLKKALELNPEQPQVLNYLGYTWVDLGQNLDQALDMIRTAVDLRPNDGYIVDSLGWAYYKLARYQEAVEQLERAVELRPQDSVINDHLGDAYWKVGRKLEATFQWSHARDLDPEPAEKEKIVKKLEHGMTAENGSDG